MDKKDYINIIKRFSNLRIAVFGDFILDKYIWGECNRISPEAPVPIVKVNNVEYRLGGAGNVAANLIGVGCKADAYGIIGDDANGTLLTDLLNKTGIQSKIKIDIKRKTTSKTRLIAQKQQIVRIDEEDNIEINENSSQQIINDIENNIQFYDALIISDYGKGVVTADITPIIIEIFKNHNKIIIVDPKGNTFTKYSNATTIKPNFNEFKKAINEPDLKLETSELEKYGHKFKESLNISGVVITLGENGVFIQNEEGEFKIIPTYAKEVFDVSGAGDTFTALFTASLCVKNDWFLAGKIANYASGIVVSKVGTYYITKKELMDVFFINRKDKK